MLTQVVIIDTIHHHRAAPSSLTNVILNWRSWAILSKEWLPKSLHFNDSAKKSPHWVLKQIIFFIFLRREIGRVHLTLKVVRDLKLKIFARAPQWSSASVDHLSFFNKTATRNIGYSCGRNALRSSNMRNGNLCESFFLLFLSLPDHRLKILLLPCDKAALQSDGGGGARYDHMKPFVRAFCFDFRSSANHKNAPLSLIRMRQRRAAASERTDSLRQRGMVRPQRRNNSFSSPFFNKKFFCFITCNRWRLAEINLTSRQDGVDGKA